jgi:hypothetical protein
MSVDTLPLHVQYQDAVSHLAQRERQLMRPANDRHLKRCAIMHAQARAEVDRLAALLTDHPTTGASA